MTYEQIEAVITRAESLLAQGKRAEAAECIEAIDLGVLVHDPRELRVRPANLRRATS